MRVLMLVPDFSPFFSGGIGTYAYGLVKELGSFGVETDVFVVPIKDCPVRRNSIRKCGKRKTLKKHSSPYDSGKTI